MIRIEIPGRETLEIISVVLDYNGTIAADGELVPGAAEKIKKLCCMAQVCILTADTYGTVKEQCRGLGAAVKTFPRAKAALCKEEIVRSLGKGTACLGNGFNDIEMFDAADLSIAVIDSEGACAALLPHADILVRSAGEGLDLLLKTDRIKATLMT